MLTNNSSLTFVHTIGMASMAHNTATELEGLGIQVDTPISIKVTTFESGQVKVYIEGNVREKDVFFFADFNGRIHDATETFRRILGALELAGVRSITVILPYIPYLRQDRKDGGRVDVSATELIDDIKGAKKVKHLITIHMHSEQVEMTFAMRPRLPYDHYHGWSIWRDFARMNFADKMDKIVWIAPDIGSVKLIEKITRELRASQSMIGIILQIRQDTGKRILNYIGPDTDGMTCIIIDDLIDTAGTLVGAIKTLYSRGAEKVIAAATHPEFNPKGDTTAYEKLGNAGAEIVVTDSLITVPHPWLKVMPLYPYLAHIIRENVTDDGSVSRLIETGLDLSQYM